MKKWHTLPLIVLLATIILTTGCITGDGESVELTYVGEETQTLTLDDLKDMPAVTGEGGRKNSVGQITLPMEFTGVSLTELYELDRAITENSAIRVTAPDGYSVTFSYRQFVEGDFITYDEQGAEIPAEGLQMIIAYEEDGEAIPEEYGGPLRIAIIGPEGPITDGHWWVRFVSKIEVLTMK